MGRRLPHHQLLHDALRHLPVTNLVIDQHDPGVVDLQGHLVGDAKCLANDPAVRVSDEAGVFLEEGQHTPRPVRRLLRAVLLVELELDRRSLQGHALAGIPEGEIGAMLAAPSGKVHTDRALHARRIVGAHVGVEEQGHLLAVVHQRRIGATLREKNEEKEVEVVPAVGGLGGGAASVLHGASPWSRF